MASGKGAGREAVRRGSDWIERLARLGFAGRGVVYIIIGYFAFRTAFAGGEAMSSTDAVRTIFGSTFGTVLLWLLVVSLAGFAVWRVAAAITDADHRGSDAKGLVIRFGYVISALVYGALGYFAASLAIGAGGSSSGAAEGARESVVAQAFEAGYGHWLTYLVALVLVVVGIVYIVRAVRASFEKYMVLPADMRPWLKPICQIGLAARGLVFIILGWLFYTGASSLSDNETPGVETALEAIRGWSHGAWLLSAMGAGLIAFGIFGFAQARYRRVEVDNP